MIVWTYPSDRSGDTWEPRPKRDAPEPSPKEAEDERTTEKPAAPKRPRPFLYVVP